MKKILSVTLVLSLLFVGSLVAQAAGLLTESQQAFFDQKEDQVSSMVEDGRLSEERADEFLEALELKLTDGTCDQTGEECDGTCEPMLNGEGEGVGIQAQAHLGEGLGQNGDGVCEFNGEALGLGAQGNMGENKGPHGDGICDLTNESIGEGSFGSANGAGNQNSGSNGNGGSRGK